ncbi:hypothetical protein [Neorhodopirellula lusitana]|uniref:hypothetical protein n=1 Tax=Neorhodopirellula lusitana TaxID=445327 RepID=UPI00385102C9
MSDSTIAKRVRPSLANLGLAMPRVACATVGTAFTCLLLIAHFRDRFAETD